MNMLSLEDAIGKEKFGKTLNGYSPRDVDKYISHISYMYNKSQNEKMLIEEKIKQYEDQDTTLRKALIRADETAERMVEMSKAEAEKIVSQAAIDAEKVTAEARQELEDAKARGENKVREATVEAKRITEQAQRDTANIKLEAESMIEHAKREAGEIIETAKIEAYKIKERVKEEEVYFKEIQAELHRLIEKDTRKMRLNANYVLEQGLKTIEQEIKITSIEQMDHLMDSLVLILKNEESEPVEENAR